MFLFLKTNFNICLQQVNHVACYYVFKPVGTAEMVVHTSSC